MAVELGRFRFPSKDLYPDAAELYVRPSSEAEHAMLAHEIRLDGGGEVRFDTYFNALWIGKLRRHTTVEHIELAVHVKGACRLDVMHDRTGHGEGTTVATVEVDATEPRWINLSLPPLETLCDGAAFLKVVCLRGSATVYGAVWRTPDQPEHPAHLGIVITTFNRPEYVQANTARLLDAITAAPAYRERLETVVVDNARTLDLGLHDGDPVQVLPNANVGGAGGFARGLSHFRGRPDITHVLFMDDDVAFDPEIIFRTVELLSFARDPRLCVGGGMLREDVPTEQFEAGARFLGTAIYPTRAVGNGVDLATWPSLLQADAVDEPLDYGAWWFFAFPITLTTENPIPAFVRGDDIHWGLQHAGPHTVTFNGIGLWHGNFVYKNGPVQWFYDTRNFALICVLLVPGYRWWNLVWRYVNTCGWSLLSFKYTSADRITAGMREFLQGPDHWLEVDQARLNQTVVSFDEERPRSLDEGLAAVDDLPTWHGARKLASALWSLAVLGGHLLPGTLDRRPIGAAPMQDRALEFAPFRPAILYRDDRRREGFLARRDRRRFFSLLGQMLVTALRIPLRFRGLERAYRAAYPRMVSDEYWNGQFAARD